MLVAGGGGPDVDIQTVLILLAVGRGRDGLRACWAVGRRIEDLALCQSRCVLRLTPPNNAQLSEVDFAQTGGQQHEMSVAWRAPRGGAPSLPVVAARGSRIGYTKVDGVAMGIQES